MELKKVFIGRDAMEAHFLCDLLGSAGIQATVMGEALSTGRGELPLTGETLPSVWVRDTDVAKALTIVDEFVKGGQEDIAFASPWKCPRCGEELEGQFDVCWNCQTPRPTT
jgi:hypothetical protein